MFQKYTINSVWQKEVKKVSEKKSRLKYESV